MKIAIIVRALPVHRLGGLEFHTHDLANAMAERGHEMHIITTGAPMQPNAVPELRAQVHYLEGTTPGDYSAGFLTGVGRKLKDLHARERFDVVHTQEFAGMFLRATGAHVVAHIHGTMFTEVPLDRRYVARLSGGEWLRALWRHKARVALHPYFLRMLKRADRLIVDSDFTRRELLRINADMRGKIRVVPLGIDPARYSPGTRRTVACPVTLAHVGRIQEQKGIAVLLSAARMLHERGLDFRLRIAGRGDFEKEGRKRIEQWGIGEKVTMTGALAASEFSGFLNAADLFVFPDLTQPAFGLVAAEAMLHGLPVIAARSGAIPETVDDRTGWLYDPWDASELAGVMQRVIGDTRSIRERSIAASERAREFTSAKMADRIEAAYR